MNRRGEARRAAIVGAAAALLQERGVDAVSHRAVAEAAGVPLAATTYYFTGLEQLLVEALEAAAAQWLDAGRAARAAHDGTRPARTLLRVAAGGSGERDRLLALYARYVEAARRPALRAVVARLDAELTALLDGLVPDGVAPRTVLAVCDGLLLAALAAGEEDPVAAAEPALSRLLAALRPPGA